MNKKHHLYISLEIDGRFGSEFQKNNATEALGLMLDTWAYFYESRHKGTKIEMWIDGKSAKYNWPR